MYSENRIEDLKWMLLVVGICLMIWGFHDLYFFCKTPVNIADLQKTDIRNGMVVEGEIPVNYGMFSKRVEYREDGPDKARYYYLIPVGEDGFMGYLSSGSDEHLRRQTQETQDYLNGVRTTLPNSVPIHGYVRHMSTKTKEHMRDYMLSIGIPSDKVDSMLVDYYIQCAYFNAWKTVLVIGVVLTIIGGAMVLSQFSIKWKR